jgi:hypothetical protein
MSLEINNALHGRQEMDSFGVFFTMVSYLQWLRSIDDDTDDDEDDDLYKFL